MGLSDRDYTQSDYFDEKKLRPRHKGGRSIVVTLVFINIALWLANGFFFANNSLTNALLLRVETAWSGYQFLTYGFVHSPFDWWHITFNMVSLMIFGYGMMLGFGPSGFGFARDKDNVENRLGRLEFTAFYFLTIIAGGIVFAMINANVERAAVLGASGGVCGVVILYAWLYPKKTLLVWGILPMPMWAIGGLIVFMDGMGASGRGFGNIAYSVHLVGAACGTLYYFLVLKRGLKLTDWFVPLTTLPPPDRKSSGRRPNLRIHTPEDASAQSPPTDDEFNRQLDEILKRYGEVGESGLTAEEREFLQRASKRYAEKRRK